MALLKCGNVFSSSLQLSQKSDRHYDCSVLTPKKI
uniref:Uncharacterized protein n=1 Tax=Anguilla anguilla TaxID=7936 RepID=A0A0E9SBC8_ANGAN